MTCTNLPVWIEAIATAVNALVVSITLPIIWGYARDTKALTEIGQQQVRVAQEQLKAAQRPFLVCSAPSVDSIFVENAGNGIAVNVAWRRWEQGNKAVMRLEHLKVGGGTRLVGYQKDYIVHDDTEVEITYDSLAGDHYRTVFSWKWDGEHWLYSNRSETV